MALATHSFLTWAAQALPASPLPGVVAYNFNIAESATAFEVEIVGSSYFDPGNSDWACEEGWTSRPSKYIAPFTTVGKEWQPFLESIGAAIRELSESEQPGAKTMRSAQAVTVGFVDGELVRVTGERDV
jgi:hypothetical protein